MNKKFILIICSIFFISLVFAFTTIPYNLQGTFIDPAYSTETLSTSPDNFGSLSVQTLNNTWLEFNNLSVQNVSVYTNASFFNISTEFTYLTFARVYNTSFVWALGNTWNGTSGWYFKTVGAEPKARLMLRLYNATGGTAQNIQTTNYILENNTWNMIGFSSNGLGLINIISNYTVDYSTTITTNFTSNFTNWYNFGVGTSSVDRANGSLGSVIMCNANLGSKELTAIYRENIHGEGRGQGVPVLYYHRVGAGNTSITIDLTNFTAQMNYLYNNGFHTVNTQQIYLWSKGQGTLPSKPININFDDAWIDTLTNATPIMNALGFTGTLGVTVNVTNYSDVDHMNWNQVIQIKNYGWEIASHAFAHNNLSLGGISNEQLQIDLQGSRDAIAQYTGYTPTYFIFPVDAFNVTTASKCSQYYNVCSGFSGRGLVYKSSNMTYGDFYRYNIINTTKMIGGALDFINNVDPYHNCSLIWNLNENNGTIVNDISGFGNNGIIKGTANLPTWNNDSVLKTLTSGVDYSFDQTTKVISITNPIYGYSQMFWSLTLYPLTEGCNVGTDNLTSIIPYLAIIFTVIILGGILFYFLGAFKEVIPTSDSLDGGVRAKTIIVAMIVLLVVIILVAMTSLFNEALCHI